MSIADMESTLGLSWDHTMRDINGAAIRSDARLSFMLEFVEKSGKAYRYPKIGEPPIEVTEVQVSGEEVGAQPGDYTVYVRAQIDYPGGISKMSGRSEGVPLSLAWHPAPADPSGLVLRDG